MNVLTIFNYACRLLIGNYIKGTTFLLKEDKSRFLNNIAFTH